MFYRKFGNTEKELSVICFGCWQMGGAEWGAVDVNDAYDAVNVAIDNGINFFDTADYYGNGRSEIILGEAIRGKRQQCFIATKGGILKNSSGEVSYNGSPSYINKAVKESLRRLKLDFIDLYQLHWPDPKVPIEDSVGELVRQQKDGNIKYIGLSNVTYCHLKRALNVGRIESVQNPYNMFQRKMSKRLTSLCNEHKISFLSYNSLCRGLLAGKYSSDRVFSDLRMKDPMFIGERFKININTVEKLKALAGRLNVDLLGLVLLWTLNQPTISFSLVGFKHAKQVAEVVESIIQEMKEDISSDVNKILKSRDLLMLKKYWYVEVPKMFIRDQRLKSNIKKAMNTVFRGKLF